MVNPSAVAIATPYTDLLSQILYSFIIRTLEFSMLTISDVLTYLSLSNNI